MAQIKGVDISNWQGQPNFDQVKTQVDFIIFKASEGLTYRDGQLDRNRSEAKRLGIPRGFYHFARPEYRNSPESEAEYFLSVLGGLDEGDVLVLDWEPSWNGDHASWAFNWLKHVFEKTGVKPLIYLNKSLQKGKDWSGVVNFGFGLWLADYENNGDAAPWQFIAMQQTTSKGSIAGINGNVDLDIFFGSVDTFKKYGFKPSIIPTPTPAPLPEPTPTDPEIDDLKQQIASLQVEKTSLANQLQDAVDKNINLNISLVDLQDKYTKDTTDLNNQINELKTSSAKWWLRFTSRKFLFPFLVSVIAILNAKLGWNIDPNAIWTALAGSGIFAAIEGYVDGKAREAQNS